MKPFFSIVVVCLNPGEKLKKTLDSIENQSFGDYEVIVKDGGSDHRELAPARELEKKFQGCAEKRRALVIVKKDAGIYDAMNQAVFQAAGRYIYFLNCGDCFYSGDVLEKMADFIREWEAETGPGIFYGNIYERLTGQQVVSNPHMDAFGCYRNVPCHQACFYDRRLLLAHPFETGYQVRADYEQFLWCFFQGKEVFGEKVSFRYREFLIADYEGGGFSETKRNRKTSAKEHRVITEKYIPRGQLFRFRLVMLLTLAPLRTQLAKNKRTAGVYNWFKRVLYLRR